MIPELLEHYRHPTAGDRTVPTPTSTTALIYIPLSSAIKPVRIGQ